MPVHSRQPRCGESQDAPAHPALLPITHERRERYLKHFGEDFWQLDVPGWRVIAMNAQLLGSDLIEAGEQLDFLRDAADGSEDRHIALFVHKPLFHASPDEEIVGGRFVNPVPRRQLLDIFKAKPPALVCSGHVHQYLSSRWQGTHHVWAPSTGFILPDARQPTYGLKQVGYVEHRLEADGSHDSRLVSRARTCRPSASPIFPTPTAAGWSRSLADGLRNTCKRECGGAGRQRPLVCRLQFATRADKNNDSLGETMLKLRCDAARTAVRAGRRRVRGPARRHRAIPTSPSP